MKKQRTLSRRQITRNIGVAAGLALIPGGLTSAATLTPKQVTGPFHPVDEQPDTDKNLVMVDGRAEPAKGKVILVRGQIVDINGEPLSDALVDVWQANHFGRYSHPKDRNAAPLDPNFQGWGLIKTDAEGRYGIKTIKPGPYPLPYVGAEGWRSRHIHFKVSHPDADTLVTQMYFEGDPLIDADQEIAKTPEELRYLLIARSRTDETTGLPLYGFDLVLAPAKV